MVAGRTGEFTHRSGGSMRAKTLFMTGLVALALLIPPGVVGTSSAAPIPGYTNSEYPALFCLAADVPDFGTQGALLVISFDPNFGFSLPLAEFVYSQVDGGVGFISQLVGQEVRLCSYGPTLLNSAALNAFQVIQIVSEVWQPYGYSAAVWIDLYFQTSPLGSFEVLRVDAFTINGPGDVTYWASIEVPRDFVGF
jgi:hypothetical protein